MISCINGFDAATFEISLMSAALSKQNKNCSLFSLRKWKSLERKENPSSALSKAIFLSFFFYHNIRQISSWRPKTNQPVAFSSTSLKVEPSINQPVRITQCPICIDKRPMDSLYCTVHFWYVLGYKCLALLPWQPMPPSQCVHFSVPSSSGFYAGNTKSSAFIQEISVLLYLKWVFD